MNPGLLGAAGGAAQGLINLSNQAIKDASDAERERRIQEYAVERMDRQAGINAEAATVANTRQVARDTASDAAAMARQKQSDSAANQRLFTQDKLNRKRAEDEERRALQKRTDDAALASGIINGAINPQTMQVDYNKARDLAVSSGYLDLANTLSSINPATAGAKLNEAVQEYNRFLLAEQAGINAQYGGFLPDEKRAELDKRVQAIMREARGRMGLGDFGAAPQPQGQEMDKATLLEAARTVIKNGADPEKVKERLRTKYNINPSEL